MKRKDKLWRISESRSKQDTLSRIQLHTNLFKGVLRPCRKLHNAFFKEYLILSKVFVIIFPDSKTNLLF